MSTKSRLEALRELEKARTQGKWGFWHHSIDGFIVSDLYDRTYIFGGESSEGYIDRDDINAQFTILAANNMAALLNLYDACKSAMLNGVFPLTTEGIDSVKALKAALSALESPPQEAE